MDSDSNFIRKVDWIELNWSELSSSELNWPELNLIEMNWIWLNGTKFDWTKLNLIEWIKLNSIELNWFELNSIHNNKSYWIEPYWINSSSITLTQQTIQIKIKKWIKLYFNLIWLSSDNKWYWIESIEKKIKFNRSKPTKHPNQNKKVN